MKRSYRDAMRAADAFSLLYRDEEMFNADLLTQFVDSIGIYPENSIVLLSEWTSCHCGKNKSAISYFTTC